MPNDNVNRVIKKTSGELDSINYNSIMYEGYGPAGSAVMVDVLTDNKNRTAGELRHYFDKFGGSLGVSNSVSYLFNRIGEIIVLKGEGSSDDDIMMLGLEAGADDVEINDTYYRIVTNPESFYAVKDFLETNKLEIAEADINFVPTNYLDLPQDKLTSFGKLISALEDNDDVQQVFHNVNLPEDEDSEE